VASLPEALHGFLAEELFASLSEPVREELTQLALRPPQRVEQRGQNDMPAQLSLEIEAIVDLESGLHPLLREFLLSKLANELDGLDRVRAAVKDRLENDEWSTAFDLIVRFGLDDMIDQAIRSSYRPLSQAGQIWTLAEFVVACMKSGNPEASGPMNLVLAHSANADGHYLLARRLAERACRQLSERDTLRPSAALVLGDSALLDGSDSVARAAYAEARRLATDDEELGEALFSIANRSINWELPNACEYVALLDERRDMSALDLVRYGIATIGAQRLASTGFSDDGLIDECVHALSQVSNPRVSTSGRWTFAYAYFLQGRYAETSALLTDLLEEIENFRLSFVSPFTQWLLAAVALARRNFGGAARHLSLVERSMEDRYVLFHDLNIRSLRARMYLQTGRQDEAWACVGETPHEATLPSMRGEYLATQGLVLAVRGDRAGAIRSVRQAMSISRGAEVCSYSELATSLLEFRAGHSESVDVPFRRAKNTRVWDPLITLLRAAPDFAEAAAARETTQHTLRGFCELIDDRALARQIRLRIRPAGAAADGRLSQRENEVLHLIAQGFKNSDVARTLFISESTVKVHVRHIFEKLGVKTRAEAAARLSLP
jgi:DNA-binding CsgD family transcriptional regulator/tetratricopeptide (TPR) repeat protein